MLLLDHWNVCKLCELSSIAVFVLSLGIVDPGGKKNRKVQKSYRIQALQYSVWWKILQDSEADQLLRL